MTADNTQTPETGWIACWSPDGFRMSIPVGNTADSIARVLNVVRELGLLPHEPDVVAGGEAETIKAVMRRVSGDGTPIIDFYPDWSHGGKFGAHKWAHMYLNTPEDIAEFEAQSGLKLDQIPLYDGQQALKRTYGSTHPKEIKPRRPFRITRVKTGEHDTGMPRYEYSYTVPANVTPMPNGSQDSEQPEPPAQQPPKPQAWYTDKNIRFLLDYLNKEDGLTAAEVFRLANVSGAKDYDGWAQYASGQAAVDHIREALDAEMSSTPPAQPQNRTAPEPDPDDINTYFSGETWNDQSEPALLSLAANYGLPEEADLLKMLRKNSLRDYETPTQARNAITALAVEMRGQLQVTSLTYRGKYTDLHCGDLTIRAYGREHFRTLEFTSIAQDCEHWEVGKTYRVSDGTLDHPLMIEGRTWQSKDGNYLIVEKGGVTLGDVPF